MINMDIIFRLILSFLHFVCDLYYFVKRQCTRLVSFAQRCRQLNKVKDNYSLLKCSELTSVPKIPKHLALLLGHEEVSLFDIVKLISWCVLAEIPFITFYDHKGNLVKNRVIVEQKLYELEPSIARKVEWSYESSKPTNGIKRISDANKIKNDTSKIFNSKMTEAINHRTRVHFLSNADGRGKVINLTKELVERFNTNGFQKESITPEFLDQKLNISNGAPNPDMAIVFGKTMSTYGFLPWQTRITEFFLLPTHHDISSNSFTETLMRFSECQQRYGK